jgi:hypothetical protein
MWTTTSKEPETKCTPLIENQGLAVTETKGREAKEKGDGKLK